jgi:hypothetical protein
MTSPATLQDFVLNLIYDPDARSAFELDPHGSLEAAGLGDVTAADVQDVLPLVLDYAPLGSLPAVDGLSHVDDLTSGVASLDLAGAVAHLQTITAQVGGAPAHLTGELNIAAAGAVTVTADHLISGLVYSGGTSADAHAGGLDASHDLAANLDASLTSPIEHTVADVTYGPEGVVSHAAITTTGTLDTTVNAATGLTGSLGLGIDGLDVPGVHEATSSIVGSVLGSDPAGGLLPDGTGAIEHHVSAVTGVAGDLTHPGTDPAEADQPAGHDLLGGLTGLHF